MLEADEPAEAWIAFTEALALKRDYLLAWTNRGTANMKLKKYDRAQADYSQAIRVDPDLSTPGTTGASFISG